MYVVTVTFEVEPGHVEAFTAAMLTQARNSLEREDRCTCFDVCRDPDHPERIFLYEIYDDRAAFDDHLASDHFKSFDRTVAPWVRRKNVETWALVGVSG
jgi:(4S)-4-hydroxy-5-phosphonooxypentane-2,3-dione isomerase